MAQKTMSSVLSDFIDMIYGRFGDGHKVSSMANEVVLAYTQGAEDEELSQKVKDIITEVNRINE